MKRFSTNLRIFIFAIAAILCMTSCAVFPDFDLDSKDKESEHDEATIVVGFSQVGSESSWRVANSESMKKALSEANGYELIFNDAKQKQENQYKAIRTFIQQKVDYIVLAPITEYGWDDVLYEAKKAGIPVIIVDRQVDVSDSSLYTCWLGSDFLQESITAMNWLENELNRRQLNDNPVEILHIQGTIGATSQILRTQGLLDAVELHDNWNITDTLQAEYTEAKAYEIMTNYLQLHENNLNANVIYSENDNMTFGILRALDEAGISYGRDGEVIVISFDAVKSALTMCIQGKINLCVECNPLHGPRIASILSAIEQGLLNQKDFYVDESSFDCYHWEDIHPMDRMY